MYEIFEYGLMLLKNDGYEINMKKLQEVIMVESMRKKVQEIVWVKKISLEDILNGFKKYLKSINVSKVYSDEFLKKVQRRYKELEEPSYIG